VAARSLIHGLWETDPWRDSVRRIEVPTLLVHGEHDRLISVVAAREMAQVRPDWTLSVMEDCGHIPMAEDPEGFVRIVVEWLGALPRRGARPARAPAP
jgi:pimeloyl-ACP methyl ester carboxylesterase